MTPTQHKAAAETLLNDLESSSRNQLTEQQTAAMLAHAELSRAAGTGAHYIAADALLVATAQSGRFYPPSHFLKARAHALLADQA